MKYNLSELIDIPMLQALFDSLNDIYPLPSAVIDTEGNVLTATAWQDICTKFHRMNPETEKKCKESDSYIVKELDKIPPHIIYKCPMGLVDSATPIVIDGAHLGNVFTGQLFLEHPDVELFKKKANQYGFDKEAYLNALKKVPVITEDKLKKNLKVLANLTNMLANIGLQQKNQKESERKYRHLFSSIRDAIIITDLDRIIVDANQPALRNVFGYEIDDIKGKKASILYSNYSSFEHAGREVFDEKKNVVGKLMEVDFKQKNGEIFTGELFALKLLGDNDEVIGSFGLIRDIAERKRMEEELLKTQKLESVGLLAGGIAHDFNNQLASILMFSNAAKINLAPYKESETYKMLDEIEKSVNNAKYLTQQLLTFSKGGVPIKKTLSLPPLLHAAVRLSVSGSNIKRNISIADDLLPVDADEGQINQVISNLVINADHAMPGGGTMDISAENVAVGEGQFSSLKIGKYVVIHISDSGIGISKEHLPKVFDPFFTTKQSGSGLGLATAYSIIKKHNGLIKVESELKEGTTFSIYLPASDKGLKDNNETEDLLIQGKGRVLVMDDDKMVLEGCDKLLSIIGYQADLAEDGNEAIEKYSKAKKSGKPYDAVIIDLTVPGGMGGIETIKELLTIDPEVKAIVSSGYADDLVMSDYKRYGFKAVLAKPYNIKKISRVVHELITGSDN